MVHHLSQNGSAILNVESLVKKYRDFTAVDGISFQIRNGETFGLLGPNGAGKTTTMRIISGLSPLTEGRVDVAGIDVSKSGREARNIIGVVTQHDGLDNQLTVRQNLEVHGYLVGLSRRAARLKTQEVLQFFNLEERGDVDIRTLSGGMKRRIAIARSMMASPMLLVMDEPTTGLDPQSRNRVWEQLGQLKQSGVTILMSTHYMIEAETLCDRVAIIDRGHLLELGIPEDVITRHAGQQAAIIQLNNAASDTVKSIVKEKLSQQGCSFSEIGSRIIVTAPEGERPELEAIKDLAEARVSYRPSNLEDVFLTLTGRELRD